MGAAKETLELEIKMLIAEARKNVQEMQGEIKRMAQEAKAAAPETTALASAMKTLNGDEMKRAAAEAKLFGESLGTLKKQQAVVRDAMINMVNDGIDPQSEEMQHLASQYKTLAAQSDKLEKQTGVTSGSLSELTSTINQLAAVKALTTIVGGVIEIGQAALDTAKQIQKTEQTFGVLLGNMSAGRALAKEIQAFNVWTPFDLANIETATKGLLGVKVPVDQLTTKMTIFGDLSLGNAEKFNSFTNEFVKASAKGKVELENLNVYLEQGVPVLDTLADQFGVTSEAVTDMVSKGQVSVADFEKALVTMTSKGGMYYQGMVTGSQSLEAVQIGLKEAQGQLVASFMTGFIPAITSVTQWMTDLTNAVNESPILKGLLAGAIVAITGTLTALAVVQVVDIAKTWLQYAAKMAYNSALSVTNVLLIAGVAAATVATIAAVAYASSQSKAAEETDKAALATVSTVQNQKLLEEQTKETTKVVDEQRQAIYDWKKSFEDFSAPSKSFDEILTKIAYLESQFDTSKTIKITVTDKDGKAKNIDTLVSDIIHDLKIKFSAYQFDPFGGSYDSFKENLESAKSLIEDFNKESSAGQTKLELLDVDKEKYSAAAIVAFTGEEQLKKQEEINAWYLKSRLEIEAELAEQDRENVLKEHELRLSKAKEEWEYRKELARLNIENGKGTAADYANYAAGSAMTQIADTDVGQIALGADPMTMFIDAIIQAAAELENVNSLLNFVGTIVDAAFDIFGPVLDSGAGDLVDDLVEIGSIVGQVIVPFMGIISLALKSLSFVIKMVLTPLMLLGDAFEWAYNSVIVPVGNSIIDLFNGIIEWWNSLPFDDIDTIDNLQLVGDAAADLSESIEDAQERINSVFDSLTDAVSELLDAQIDSLKDQYELGLITRDSYQDQVASATKIANDEINALDEKRNDLLEEIADNTSQSGLDSDLASILETYSGKTITVPSFDVGSTNIPRDMLSILHKDEMVISKPFADGVRDNSITIGGLDPEETAITSNNKYVNSTTTIEINVEGSVLTEKELNRKVYDGLADLITSGEKTPLPAA